MRGSSPQGSPVSQTMPSQLFLALADVFKPAHTTCSNAWSLQPCSGVSERRHRTVWPIKSFLVPHFWFQRWKIMGRCHHPSIHSFLGICQKLMKMSPEQKHGCAPPHSPTIFLWISPHIRFFSHGYDKVSGQSSLKRKRFILAQSQGYSLSSRGQSGGRQRRMLVLSLLSPFYLVLNSMEDGNPQLG